MTSQHNYNLTTLLISISFDGGYDLSELARQKGLKGFSQFPSHHYLAIAKGLKH